MKQAIIVPYAADQNEPLRPISKIVGIPDDQEERDQALSRLFFYYVLDNESLSRSDLEIREGSEDSYGDIVVSYDDSIFMYVIFVK